MALGILEQVPFVPSCCQVKFVWQGLMLDCE